MFVFSVFTALIVSTASAHGPAIQITADEVTAGNYKINTRQILPGEPYTSAGLSAPARIYVLPVLATGSLVPPQTVARVRASTADTFGPGYTYGYDQTVGSTRLFTASVGLHLSGLLEWDGSAFVPTGEEQIGVLVSSNNTNPDTATTTAAGADVSFTPSTSYNSNGHNSLRYTLKVGADSTYAASDPGVYLLGLQLSGTQSSPPLAASDLFYFVLGKDVSSEALVSVANSFAASQGIASNLIQYAPTAVPEPSAVLLAAIGCVSGTALGTRRRKG
jgi:hypothetical protein